MGRYRSKQTLAYIRVSTDNQDTTTQENYHKSMGVRRENMFIDKKSGSTGKRKNLQKMLKEARRGDIIKITAVDRLSRNQATALKIRDIAKRRGFKLDIQELDSLPYGTKKWDSCFNALAYEAERELIDKRSCTQEGIDIAAKYGRKGGRRPIKQDVQNKVHTLSEQGKSIAEISIKLNISTSSVSNIRKKYSDS